MSQSPQEFPCANGCGTPLTVADNANGGLVSVNVDGHAKAAHRDCPTALRTVAGESASGETSE